MKRILLLGLAAIGALTLCECKGQSVNMRQHKTYKAPDDAMAYDVRLALTPAALKQAQVIQSSIVVAATYYGLPTAASMPRANRLHEIELGDERTAVAPTAASAHMTGALDRSQLPDVVDGVAYVLVTAYSVGPNGAADDSIHCRSYRGPVSQAKATGAVVSCDVDKPD